MPSFNEFFIKFIEVVAQDIRTRQTDAEHKGDEIRRELLQKTELREILDAIRLGNLRNGAHPKLLKLHQILTAFFSSEISQQENSKVIVFTQSRASAKELLDYLTKKSLVIRAAMFVGQATRFGQKGMNQEEQQAVIQKLKTNELNLLIATSVAEEGLDIGEVDLIVCFDSGLSPIRLVQRMGRTGRKRRGRVILLLMENEHAVFQASIKRYREIMISLQGTQSNLLMYSFSPRMIPDDIKPKLKYQTSNNEENELAEAEEEATEKINNLVDEIVRNEETNATSRKLRIMESAEENGQMNTRKKEARQSIPMSEQDKKEYELKLVRLVDERELSRKSSQKSSNKRFG